MKQFSLAAIAAASLLAAGLPVNAGLGAATSKSSAAGYDAWCGEKGNDCNIVFSSGRITVDKKDSVSFEDITYITKNIEGRYRYERVFRFGIEYKEKGMSEPEFAEVLFMHEDTAERFWRDLRRACRNCKDRDATQVEVNIKD